MKEENELVIRLQKRGRSRWKILMMLGAAVLAAGSGAVFLFGDPGGAIGGAGGGLGAMIVSSWDQVVGNSAATVDSIDQTSDSGQNISLTDSDTENVRSSESVTDGSAGSGSSGVSSSRKSIASSRSVVDSGGSTDSPGISGASDDGTPLYEAPLDSGSGSNSSSPAKSSSKTTGKTSTKKTSGT